MYICLVPDEHNQHLYFFVVNDDYIPTMEEMHEYGVYANEVDIVFDQEELSDSSDEDYEPANGNFRTRSKDLTTAQRQQIYEALLEKSNRGKLKRNTTTEVAELFHVNRHASGIFGDKHSNVVLMECRLMLVQESPRIVAAKRLKSTPHK